MDEWIANHHVAEDLEGHAKDETQPDLVELEHAGDYIAVEWNEGDDVVKPRLISSARPSF